MRYLPNQTAVTNFSMATTRSVPDGNNGYKDETTWWRVTVWGKQAESANQYLSKGKKVLVEGVITPDPNTGNPRTFTRRDGSIGASFEIKADVLKFLSGNDSAAGRSTTPASQDVGGGIEDVDEIPF